MADSEQSPSQGPEWDEVARFLRSPGAFATARPLQVIETHISLVFLGDELVYKLKKPVRFDFLDFSTVELRRQACAEELRLNQRLAAGVYLGVVPVTVDPQGRLAVDGAGCPVEWMVKMRRLPQERMLDSLIEGRRAQPVDTTELASLLVRFYRNQSPVSISATDLTERMSKHIRANMSELLRPEHHLPEALVKRIHSRQLQFANFESDLFDSRIHGHHVIDGHGDLRPEHVCLEHPPVIFDCIEFNAEFRQLDVVDELCFLAMECERLHAKTLGDVLIAAYAKATGDTPEPRLLNFYKSYRACVRAKVAVLKATQDKATGTGSAGLARSYLELAYRDLGPASRQLCIIVRGLSGSGKSTIATSLSELLGLEIIQSDRVRGTLGKEWGPPVQAGLDYGSGRYSAAQRRDVYQRMFDLASAHMADGLSVVLDACFLRQGLQRHVHKLAQSIGVPLVIVNCHCPDAVAHDRVIARSREPGCLSEVLPEHLCDQKHDDEGTISDVPAMSIDTSVGAPSSHTLAIVRYLGQTLKPIPAPWRPREREAPNISKLA